MKEIIVNQKYDGKKLNNFLLDTFPGLSPNLFYKTLRKKDIRVNGIKITENVTLSAGDKVSIYLSDEQLASHYSKLIDIVYEDDNIVILNKPAGIEVTGENSLSTILNFSPCHRLDRNTTGLVLFAKNEEALSILLEKFKHHEIEKHYRATVIGIPAKTKSTLVAYLFKDAKKSLVYISDVPKKGYEKIVTSYQVISINKKQNTSILDVTLHTGKTHQIRAHLAHIGHPIVGDGKYGNNEINKKLGYKTQQLCSYSLTFAFQTDSGILSYLKNKQISLTIFSSKFSNI